MKIFLDTEFNSFRGQLISMGMVTLDGQEFYIEMPLPAEIHPWVQEHVIPHLGGATVRPENDLQAAVVTGLWLEQSDDGDLEIVADWPEDFAHLCNLLCAPGGRRSGPDSFKMLIRRDIGSEGSTIPHHALHDAKALRESFLKLEAIRMGSEA